MCSHSNTTEGGGGREGGRGEGEELNDSFPPELPHRQEADSKFLISCLNLSKSPSKLLPKDF